MMACVTHALPSDHAAAGNDPRARPIGVFDSGVGGLTVLHELLVRLPYEDFVYLGDTARFPYGERTPEELARFSSEIAEELLRRRAKLLVIACNSATAAALPILERRMMETTLGVDVLGVVRPEALRAVAATRNGRIGLLATPTTVASGSYERAVSAVDPHVTLHPVACPELASIIQAGHQFDERAVASVREACAPLRAARGRHGHPRLHPLPADPSYAAADARARGNFGQFRRSARASSRARALHPLTVKPAPTRRGRLPLPLHRRHRNLP